jgi:hypothetical protein
LRLVAFTRAMHCGSRLKPTQKSSGLKSSVVYFREKIRTKKIRTKKWDVTKTAFSRIFFLEMGRDQKMHFTRIFFLKWVVIEKFIF